MIHNQYTYQNQFYTVNIQPHQKESWMIECLIKIQGETNWSRDTFGWKRENNGRENKSHLTFRYFRSQMTILEFVKSLRKIIQNILQKSDIPENRFNFDFWNILKPKMQIIYLTW